MLNYKAYDITPLEPQLGLPPKVWKPVKFATANTIAGDLIGGCSLRSQAGVDGGRLYSGGYKTPYLWHLSDILAGKKTSLPLGMNHNHGYGNVTSVASNGTFVGATGNTVNNAVWWPQLVAGGVAAAQALYEHVPQTTPPEIWDNVQSSAMGTDGQFIVGSAFTKPDNGILIGPPHAVLWSKWSAVPPFFLNLIAGTCILGVNCDLQKGSTASAVQNNRAVGQARIAGSNFDDAIVWNLYQSRGASHGP